MSEDPDIVVGRLLREALGIKTPAGACHDCGGIGVVPSGEMTQEAREEGCGVGVFKDCPTCRGLGIGGAA